MKGCLAVVGFVVVGVMLAVGVVVAVERHGSIQREALTEEATRVDLTSSVRETRGQVTRQRDGWAITYRYEAGSRTFTSSTWVVIDSLDIDVCVDPDDPAVHGLRADAEVPCGDAITGGVREAEEVFP